MKYLLTVHTDIAFKVCIVISLAFHLCLFAPWPFFSLIFKPHIAFDKIELTYFNENQKTEILIRELEPITSIIKQKNAPVAAQQKESSASVPVKQTVKVDENKIIPKELSRFEEPLIAAKKVKEETEMQRDYDQEAYAKKGAIYEKYYLDVREKIKSNIDKNKRLLLKEGEVRVRFTVIRDGTLKDLSIQRAQGQNTYLLEDMAVKSLKESSPFPPFYDEISENELSFSLPIRVTHRY